MLVPHADPTEL